MKKTFQLKESGQDDQRVLEAIKHEVRKYVKRERRKPLKAGVDFWDFDCRIGTSEVEAAVKHPAEVAAAIDAVAATETATAVYVEILAKPGHRLKKAVAPQVEPEATVSLESADGSESH